jgi:hypothetical protein
MEGAGALGNAAGILHGTHHPIIAYFVIAGIVYGLLPLIFPTMRDSLWYGRRPFKKRPLSEERVLDREELIRVMEHRPQSLLRRVLAKLRH